MPDVPRRRHHAVHGPPYPLVAEVAEGSEVLDGRTSTFVMPDPSKIGDVTLHVVLAAVRTTKSARECRTPDLRSRCVSGLSSSVAAHGRAADAVAAVVGWPARGTMQRWEERIGVWRWERRSVSRFDQFRSSTAWEHPVLAFGVCPARGSLTRLDRAFQAFYNPAPLGAKRLGFPGSRARPGGTRWSIRTRPARVWSVSNVGTGRSASEVWATSAFGGRGAAFAVPRKTLTVRREELVARHVLLQRCGGKQGGHVELGPRGRQG